MFGHDHRLLGFPFFARFLGFSLVEHTQLLTVLKHNFGLFTFLTVYELFVRVELLTEVVNLFFQDSNFGSGGFIFDFQFFRLLG